MQEIVTTLIFCFFSFIAGASKERVLLAKRNTELGVLSGEEAEKFLKQLKENENKKVSPEELEIIKKNYEIMKKLFQNQKHGNE